MFSISAFSSGFCCSELSLSGMHGIRILFNDDGYGDFCCFARETYMQSGLQKCIYAKILNVHVGVPISLPTKVRDAVPISLHSMCM